MHFILTIQCHFDSLAFHTTRVINDNLVFPSHCLLEVLNLQNRAYLVECRPAFDKLKIMRLGIDWDLLAIEIPPDEWVATVHHLESSFSTNGNTKFFVVNWFSDIQTDIFKNKRQGIDSLESVNQYSYSYILKSSPIEDTMLYVKCNVMSKYSTLT